MSGEDPTVADQFKIGKGSFEKFKSITDIDEASDYFCDIFERPAAATAHKDQRRANAHMYYEEFKGTFSGSSDGGVIGSTSFTTFDLTEPQLKALATVCQQENGATAKGAAAEASLMANHMDLNTLYAAKYPDTGDGLYQYVYESPWFAGSGNYMNSYVTPSNGPLRDDVLEAVRSVLVGGRRILPGYIDEHDAFNYDYNAYNGGVQINRADRSQYIPHSTNIKNYYGGDYTFWGWADEAYPTSDPFGYSSAENRQRIGEFYFDFDSGAGVGQLVTAEIPKAAKNINFPYSLIRNGYHEIIVNRYDLQKYNLNTKYKEYIEYKKKSVATVQVIQLQIKDEKGSIISNSTYPTVLSCDSDTIISETPKSTRENANGSVDPKLEDFVSSSTSVTNKYYLHRAFTFDMVYTNEFDYQKYSDEDVAARRNAHSESVTNRVPYTEKFDDENRFTGTDLFGRSIVEIAGAYGASYTQIDSSTNITTDSDGNTRIEIKRIYDVQGQEFIEHEGEEIYLSRTWSDNLSQSSSKSNQVDYNEMVEFNENKEEKTNRSTITRKEFEKSKADEYKKYKHMSKLGELNFIDIINSNPKLIATYLNETSKQSEYMGYTKEDDLLVSYSELKNLVEQTENESGVVPYAYFISLGHEMGYSNQKMIENEVSNGFDSSGGGFGWPVDLEGNKGARVINCIYPYTPAYGSSHGAIDIAPGKGDNIIIAAKDGVIKNILVDRGNKRGYGNSVLIEHEGGFYTRYSHLESIYSDIVIGAEVKKGDELGVMGTTGNSTGVHLDFEIYEGGTSPSNRVDPLDYYITEPEYGSIDPKKITKLPSGYKFLKEMSGGSKTGSTSTGLVKGKTNILIIAGHATVKDVRGYSSYSGYDETRETRKLAIALSNAINEAGMNAVIANRVLAGNKDAYDGDVIWGRYSLYAEGSANRSVYDQFSGFDHAIEIHFNATGSAAKVSGSLLVSPSSGSITALDNKLLQAVSRHTISKRIMSPSIQGILNISQLRARGVNITYLETEFYDNKAAMDYVSKNYEAMAKDMAQVLKEHFK